MLEEHQDVNSEELESSTNSEDTPVEESAEQEQQENQTSDETQDMPETPTGESDVDTKGVPWKNRAMEWQRKYSGLVDDLPTIIGEQMKQALAQNSNQDRKYSAEDLEVFLTQTEDPAHRQWAQRELRKLEKEEQRRIVREEIQNANKKRTDQEKRQQSFNYVIQSYPELFQKDANGHPSGWNMNHPMAKEIDGLMKNKKLADDPEGLMAAADIAYARYARSQQPKNAKKLKDLEAEAKGAKKQTMVEGGGAKVDTTAVNPVKNALGKLKQSGRKEDAQEAIRAIFRAGGYLT